MNNNNFSHKNWQVFRLNELCTTRSGIEALSHPYISNEESIPYIKPRDICFNTIISANEYISLDLVRQGGAAIVPKESILLAVTGSNAGNIALLGKDAVVNQHIFYATIQNSLAKPKYLYYYLYFKKHMLVTVSKYAIRGSHRSLQNLQIPLPSLKEQDEIIQYLDLHFNETGISIAETKQAIQEINCEKKLLINRAFLNHGEYEASDQSEILQLRDCGFIHAGVTPNSSIKEYYGSDYPLFKPTDFRQPAQLESAETYLSIKGLKLAGFVRANSLVVCCSGANLGCIRITKIDGACSQQIISFTPNDGVLPDFVYFQMNSDSFREQFFARSKNSTINLSVFKNLFIRINNFDQQQNIVNRLRNEISILDKKESELHKKMASLHEAKRDFLFQAFSSSLLIKANVIALIFISIADRFNLPDVIYSTVITGSKYYYLC